MANRAMAAKLIKARKDARKWAIIKRIAAPSH
jgi:hypothetical protein